MTKSRFFPPRLASITVLMLIVVATYILTPPASAQSLTPKEVKQLREEVRRGMSSYIEKSTLQSELTLTPEHAAAFRTCWIDGMTETIMKEVLLQTGKGTASNFDPAEIVNKNAELVIRGCIIGPAGKNAQTVSDVVLDYHELSGKSVAVKGFYMPLGELNYLYEKAGSMPFLIVDTAQLSRDERKKILQNCGRGCNATFFGAVKNVNFNKGISATISEISR